MPSYLKLTCYTLALVADADQGFANIYFSKRKIGELQSTGERVAAENISDLVAFGVLRVVDASKGGKTTRYQLVVERLVAWSTETTQKLAEIRRLRRERYPKNGESEPRSVLHGSRRRKRPNNPDPYAVDTTIRTAGEPRSVLQRSTPRELPNELMVDQAGPAPVDAVENSAGQVGELSAESSAPSAGTGAAFHILSGIGRKLLAENGLGEFPSTELRSHLRSRIERLGITGDSADLVNRVEDSLRAQWERHRTLPHPAPYPPSTNQPYEPPTRSPR
jgi:hypothetical protein